MTPLLKKVAKAKARPRGLWWKRVDGFGRGEDPRGPSPAAQDDTPSKEGGNGKGKGNGNGKGKGKGKGKGNSNSQCGDSSLRSE
jgi:hypothetical protein